MEDGVIELGDGQRRRAGELLARAFHNDPTYVVVIPEEGKRAKALPWLFNRVVGDALLLGQVYTTPTLEGAICWLPPGQTGLTIGGILRSGLYATPLKMGLPAYGRFDAYMSYADKLHEHYAPESHWYLWAIGVDPSSQGRGIGSRLLQPVLEQASADGTACYLETGTERNIRFYEKHGFRVVSEGKVPKLAVPVWAMVRKAADV